MFLQIMMKQLNTKIEMKTKFKNPNKIEYRFPKEHICEYCSGDGYTEYLSCNAPVSDCCGGCYKREKCNECDGDGYFTDWENFDYMKYQFKNNRLKFKK